ncbi:MAG: hypothetical protein JXR56_00750 [Candidatus Cloacimonetes bacterium]|nr:hypothetical protein [Candidatus Cloacimonadota bacterium]
MAKIEFKSKNRFGSFNIPDDAVLKVPKGTQISTDPEPTEPLYPVGAGPDGDAPIGLNFPDDGPADKNEAPEPLLPIL